MSGKYLTLAGGLAAPALLPPAAPPAVFPALLFPTLFPPLFAVLFPFRGFGIYFKISRFNTILHHCRWYIKIFCESSLCLSRR